MKLRALVLMAAISCNVLMTTDTTSAQMALPEAKALDGATAFRQQCGVCHTTNLTDTPRQGPTMAKIVGRKAGSVDSFKYSAGFALVDFSWDETRLDAWLTNPQAVIPGAVMAYKQAKPEVRTAIIGYLKGLN